MTYRYRPSGVCSREINVEIENGIIVNVQFVGGCHGNAQGLSALLKGMPVQEAIDRLSGIRCGFKSTSCPDQLTRALRQATESSPREATI